MPQPLRTKVNLVLLGVLILALALLVGLLSFGPTATQSTLAVFGVTSVGDEEQARIDAITTAARNELGAIYTMNWKDAQGWAAAAQGGATGDLLAALQASGETDKARMFQTKTTGTLDILSFAINKISPPDAKTSQWTAVTLAYVVTRESRESAKSEATPTCPASTVCVPYGLEVDLILTPDGWKVSKVVRDR